MYEFLFIISAILYTIVSIYIFYWSLLLSNGFYPYVPILFIKQPLYYEAVRLCLFSVSAFAVVNIDYISWYFGIIFLILLQAYAALFGGNKYNKYIKKLKEGANNE